MQWKVQKQPIKKCKTQKQPPSVSRTEGGFFLSRYSYNGKKYRHFIR